MDGYLIEKKESQVMLRSGNRVFYLMIFISCVSCIKQEKKYNDKEIKKIRENCIHLSMKAITQDEYWRVYEQVNDSVDNWIKQGLNWYKYYAGQRVLCVDSVLCFNRTSDKMIASILKRCLDDCVQDDIGFLYGVKIKDRWYFFDGPTLVLPREYYQEDIHTPLSFEKIKQIATANIYKGYLLKSEDGSWEINDAFFERVANKNFDGDGFGSCFECETEEEYYLYLVKRKWEKHRESERKAIESKRNEEIMKRYRESLEKSK